MNVTVTRLITAGNGDNYVGTSGAETSIACAAESGIYLKLDMSASQAQALYSHILSAHLAGRALNVKLSERQAIVSSPTSTRTTDARSRARR